MPAAVSIEREPEIISKMLRSKPSSFEAAEPLPPPPKSARPRPALSSSLSNKITGARTTASKDSGPTFRPTIKSTEIDNFWADKQEVAFSSWLNFALSGVSPPPVAAAAHAEPTGDSLSQKRLGARQRQAVVDLYNSDSFTETVDAVMKEVFEKGLQIREDRDVNSDVGLREKFVDVLMCYDQTWLKVCLEVVCGEAIHPYYVEKMQRKADAMNSSMSVSADASAMDVSVSGRAPASLAVSAKGSWKTQVKTFILDKMVDDALVRQRYAGLSSFTHEKQLKDELSQYTICKFLSLVLLLDKARQMELLTGSVLFLRSAPFKSSKEIVQEFCKSFLKGEGDVMRHLGLLGFDVRYAQTYLDEFDYRVSSLASDLRDGVRLARVAERLAAVGTGPADRSLRGVLRVPAISRLQKLHNVQQTLLFLNQQDTRSVRSGSTSFDVATDSKAVVDGNREGTLLVLWKLICGHELSCGIDPETVAREAVRIEFEKGIDSASAARPDCAPASDPVELLFQSIARWCLAIAHPRQAALDNFTSCFTDNRIVCLVINYYRPDILSLESIHLQFDPAGGSRKESLKMEKHNFSLLLKACSTVGGIPMLLNACDSKNVPEEKTMVYFLTILYKRLLESSGEAQASVRVQRCFRRWKQRRDEDALQKGRHAKHTHSRHRRNTTTATARSSASASASVLVASRRRHSVSGGAVPPSPAVVVSASKQIVAAARINEWVHRMRRRPPASACACVCEEEDASPPPAMEDTHVINLVEEMMSEMVTEMEEKEEEEEEEEDVNNTVISSIHTRTQEELDLKEQELERLRAELDCSRREGAERLQREIGLREEELARAQREMAAERAAAEEIRALRDQQERGREQQERDREQQEREKEQQERDREQQERERLLVEARAVEKQAADAALRGERDREEAERQLIMTQLEAGRQEKDRIEREKAQELLTLKEMYEKELSQRQTIEDVTSAIEGEKRRLCDEHERDVRRREQQAAEALLAAQAERDAAEQTLRSQAGSALEAERQARLALEAQVQEMQAEKAKAEQTRLELEAIKLENERKSQLRLLKSSSALCIQTSFRRFSGSKAYYEIKQAAILTQAWVRGRGARSRLAVYSRSAAVIQRRVRAVRAQRAAALLRVAGAVSIQAVARGFAQRQRLALVRGAAQRARLGAAAAVQAWWRSRLLARQEVSYIRRVTLLQAVARRRCAVNQLRTVRAAARSIQMAYRGFASRALVQRGNASRREEARRLCVAGAVLARFGRAVAQRLRFRKAVAIISRWVVAYRPLIRIRIMMKGFTRLQAFFRSYKKRHCAPSAVKKARLQIKAAECASRADPSQRLGHLTRNALRTLKKGKMISQICKACHTLDTATRYSAKCCAAFTAAGATKALLHLIRSCNRSTPHQEILRLSICILLNVVRHPDLAVRVALDFDGTDVVVDLMQMFRDKQVIFNSSCELLGCMVGASPVIKDLCNHSELRKRLDGIFHIMERKNRLDARIQGVTKRAASSSAPASKAQVSSFSLLQHLVAELNK
jgi:hypothetical protein